MESCKGPARTPRGSQERGGEKPVPKSLRIRFRSSSTPQRNVKIGITDYFLDQLKEIVNIQTDKAGERVSKDEPFGVVETWWFTYDLYSPLNAKIVSVNKAVIDDPFTLNVDPYQWIMEVQPKKTEVDSLMNGLLSLGEYKKLIMKLEGRLILR